MEKRTPLFLLWMAILSMGLFLGIYAVFKIYTVGHAELSNPTSRLPWGIQVSTYIYMALTSTGCSFICCLANMAGVERLKPIVPRALVLALLTLLAGFGSLGLELGRLERMAVAFVFNPNLLSPMWWMGAFYTIKMIVLIVELILMAYQNKLMELNLMKLHHEKVHKVVNWVSLISGICAVSSLGSVLGLLEMRSFTFGAFTPIYFISMSFLSGAALITLITSISIWLKGSDEELGGTLETLRRIFVYAIVTVFILSLWRDIVGVWVSNPGYELFEIDNSSFWLFSILFGIAIPLLISTISKSPAGLSLAAVIVLIVQFIDRNILVVGTQRVPILAGVWEPPVLSYSPSTIEILVIIAVISFIGFVFSIAEKTGFFEVSEHH